jgi:hypothetical protein
MENEIGNEKVVHGIGPHFGPRPHGYGSAQWVIRPGKAQGRAHGMVREAVRSPGGASAARGRGAGIG